jgi:hemerythrin-like domain-containing protein
VDIYTLLRGDHRRMSELFDRIESAGDNTKERDALFEQLKRELRVHKEAEEATFYAALSLLPEISDRIEEALEEHVDIDELLDEFEESDEDDSFAGQLAELREEVEHHVSEEENDIFHEARELLTEEQAERIAEEMQAAKERLAS